MTKSGATEPPKEVLLYNQIQKSAASLNKSIISFNKSQCIAAKYDTVLIRNMDIDVGGASDLSFECGTKNMIFTGCTLKAKSVSLEGSKNAFITDFSARGSEGGVHIFFQGLMRATPNTDLFPEWAEISNIKSILIYDASTQSMGLGDVSSCMKALTTSEPIENYTQAIEFNGTSTPAIELEEIYYIAQEVSYKANPITKLIALYANDFATNSDVDTHNYHSVASIYEASYTPEHLEIDISGHSSNMERVD